MTAGGYGHGARLAGARAAATAAGLPLGGIPLPRIRVCTCGRDEQVHTVELRGGHRGAPPTPGCRAFTTARERLDTAAAHPRLAAVLRLHVPEGAGGHMCAGCGRAWPCPTAQACLGGRAATREGDEA